MPWREEAEKSMPPQKPNEPARLRLDILDELEDHLTCAVVREREVSDNGKEAVWGRVLDKFGDPAALARRLWWDAMREAIMREWIKTSAIVAMALVIVAFMGFTLRYIQNNNQTMLQTLQEIKASSEIAMTTLEITVRRESEDGKAVEGLKAALYGKLFNEDKTTIEELSDTNGKIIIGPVRQGVFYLRLLDPITGMNAEKEITFLGGKKNISIVAPPSNKSVPVEFKLNTPETADDDFLMLAADLFYDWEGNGLTWKGWEKFLLGKTGAWEVSLDIIPGSIPTRRTGNQPLANALHDFYRRKMNKRYYCQRKTFLTKIPVNHFSIRFDHVATKIINKKDPTQVLFAIDRKPYIETASNRYVYPISELEHFSTSNNQEIKHVFDIPMRLSDTYYQEAKLAQQFKQSKLPAAGFHKLHDINMVCVHDAFLEEAPIPNTISPEEVADIAMQNHHYPISFHYFKLDSTKFNRDFIKNNKLFLLSELTDEELSTYQENKAFVLYFQGKKNVNDQAINYTPGYPIRLNNGFHSIERIHWQSELQVLNGVLVAWLHPHNCQCHYCSSLPLPRIPSEVAPVVNIPLELPSQLHVVKEQETPKQHQPKE